LVEILSEKFLKGKLLSKSFLACKSFLVRKFYAQKVFGLNGDSSSQYLQLLEPADGLDPRTMLLLRQVHPDRRLRPI
jgi:hypothetical protein